MDKNLEQQVWERAKHCCEYCLFPAEFAETPFQIDHIIAEKHRGRTESDNLALSCFYCNSYKGPCISGVDDETDEVTRLFNPRGDLWSDHFQWNGATLVAKTAIGRATIATLRINEPDLVRKREALIDEGVFPPKSTH